MVKNKVNYIIWTSQEHRKYPAVHGLTNGQIGKEIIDLEGNFSTLDKEIGPAQGMLGNPALVEGNRCSLLGNEYFFSVVNLKSIKQSGIQE